MAYDYTEKKEQDASYDPEVTSRALQMIRDNAAQQRQQALQPLTQQKNEALSAYLNRGDFQYDFNADALYQNYKDRYTQLGKMAMQDTMGQAAALTGGYGSSYAQNVGQQAYNQYMTELADVIPELYQMAYARYQDKGNDLLQRYSLLAGEEEAEYARQYQKEQEAVADYQWQAAYDYQAEQDRQAALKAAEQKAAEQKAAEQKASAAAANAPLEKYKFAGVDNDGNYRYYLGDKQVTYAQGINPHTGTLNPDAKNGTFGQSGYQPNNIGGDKLTWTGQKAMINGHEQKVWQKSDGSMYLWDDKANRYEQYRPDGYSIRASAGTAKFKSSVPSRSAFGGGQDYQEYIENKIDEWLAAGKLTNDDAATLLRQYGFA